MKLYELTEQWAAVLELAEEGADAEAVLKMAADCTERGGNMMGQYRECPHCGAHLDACERCDCQKKEKAATANSDSEQPSNHSTCL